MIKTNGAVALVAMGGLLLVQAVKSLVRREWRRTVTTVCILALTAIAYLGGTRAVYRHYEAASGLQVRDGVPAAAYFAMGMTENGNGLYGWYNGDNVRYLQEADGDSKKASEAAGTYIRDRLAFFAKNPRSALKFYGEKFLSQWADPTKVSLREQEMTGRHQEGIQPQLGEVMTFGAGYQVMQQVMHYFHLFLYFFAFMGLRSYGKGGRTISEYQVLLPLFVFGGMLFHQIWEASGRYTLRYELALMPLAAAGMVRVLDKKGKKRGKS